MATTFGIVTLQIGEALISTGDLMDLLLPSGELLRGSMEESAFLQGDELDLIRADLPEALRESDGVIDLRVSNGTRERSVYLDDHYQPQIWLLQRSLLDWPNMHFGGVDVTVGNTVSVTQDNVTHTLTLRQMSVLREAHHLALAPEHLRAEPLLIRLLGTNGETVWLHGREEPTVHAAPPNLQMPALHAPV